LQKLREKEIIESQKYSYEPQIMHKGHRDDSMDIGERLYSQAQEKEDKLVKKRMQIEEQELSNSHLRLPTKSSRGNKSHRHLHNTSSGSVTGMFGGQLSTKSGGTIES
jgi:hypothetical protein